MAFKIILTVLFALDAVLTLDKIDEPRKPITQFVGIGTAVFASILIYGVWAWI